MPCISAVTKVTMKMMLNTAIAKSMSTSSPGEDILDAQACNDILYSELHWDEERQQTLQKNCLCLLHAVPFNFELAKFCFSRSKFFQLKKDDQTLGLRMQQVVNIFNNDEFKNRQRKHHVWVDVVLCGSADSSQRCVVQNMLYFQKNDRRNSGGTLCQN